MKYFLYYAGLSKETRIEQVGVATSNDFKNWEYVGGKPIVPVKSQGVFDSEQTSNPCVLKHNGVYKMWYQGRSIDGAINICYTESKDGLFWNMNNKVVLSPKASNGVSFREGYHHPHVIFDDKSNEFKMWCVVYHNGLASIGYCQSSDGVQWKEVLETDLKSTDENLKYFYPCVLENKYGFKMWFTERIGKKWQICFASSSDGLKWDKSVKNPLLSSSFGFFSTFVLEAFAKFSGYCPKIPLYGIGSPFVWKEEGVYRLIGHAVGPRGKLYIPMYESNDGLSWIKIKNNILPIPTSEWNSFFQADPFIYAE